MKIKHPTFEEFYQNIYQERWAELKSSLSENHKVIRSIFGQKLDLRFSSFIYNYPTYLSEHHQILKDENLSKKFYVMDPASIICAQSLNVAPNDFVLDMCAAPGGKSLILLESLTDGLLWSNEISNNRRTKLKSVIKKYVPKDDQNKIFIKGKDAIKYGMQYPNTFDKILLDAPCSGEKHLLHNLKELSKWSPKRTKKLAKTQYALLCSAILALKEQGELIYSTCSLSPFENDYVIKRALERKSDMIKLMPIDLEEYQAEKTECGYHFLPDTSKAGPIYMAKLKKIKTS